MRSHHERSKPLEDMGCDDFPSHQPKPQGKHAERCSATFDPISATLGPNVKMNITVNFITHTVSISCYFTNTPTAPQHSSVCTAEAFFLIWKGMCVYNIAST